jgi:hypothetical protein
VDNKSKKDLDEMERLELFRSEFEPEIDAGYTLVELVRAAGLYLGKILGESNVAVGMREMLAPSCGEEDDWHKMLDEVAHDAFSEWRLGQKLHDLAAYAHYGIAFPPTAHDHGDSTEEVLKDLVLEAAQFLKESPIEQWLAATPCSGTLSDLVLLARNRWALDHLQPIEPAALARFGGVTEARIRNMMAGSSSQFTNQDGKIPAPEALAWLAGRESFYDSIWREKPIVFSIESGEDIERPLFLPVARDGSVFHPVLARKDGFQVGPKGDERYIETFEEALAELQRMAVPYWRRPNEKGKPGIVRGVRWERYDLSALPGIQPDSKGGHSDA